MFVTEWNSSALVKAATKTGKKKNALTPMTFSLLHATDFADRLLYKIIPPLKAGMIVLADRYAYTAFARDATRGVDRQWVRELYSFAVRPTSTLYFRVPIDVSLDRLMARRVKLKFYEAGMDLGWSANPIESFRLFQGKVLDEYDRLVDEFGLNVVDAVGSITEQQRLVRDLDRAARLTTHVTQRGDHSMSNPSDLTTPAPTADQRRIKPAALLRPRHPVSADRRLSRQADRHRGHRRRRPQHADSAAARMARGQGLRRRRDRLDAVAADAADDRAGQVEQHAQQADVRAALRDRLRRSAREGNHPGAQGRLRRPVGSLHLHGAGARRRARRRSAVAAQPVRLRDRAAPGVLPERSTSKTLIGRVLESRGMDFWESGMDLKHGDDIYDSFRAYQNKLLREYASMADEFHFRVARRPPVRSTRSQDELRREGPGFSPEPHNRSKGSKGSEGPRSQRSEGSDPLDPCSPTYLDPLAPVGLIRRRPRVRSALQGRARCWPTWYACRACAMNASWSRDGLDRFRRGLPGRGRRAVCVRQRAARLRARAGRFARVRRPAVDSAWRSGRLAAPAAARAPVGEQLAPARVERLAEHLEHLRRQAWLTMCPRIHCIGLLRPVGRRRRVLVRDLVRTIATRGCRSA